ncbi:MAG TPA: non-ribosomal peptide synthetase [Mucilaginibacter sp.]|jgi:acyl-CoA synthetase (AMP-forming)/AMP-acid ligase II
MNVFKTLVQALIENENPSASIHFINGVNDTRSITYNQLLNRSLGLLKHFQESGVDEGDELILLTQRNEAFIEGFWASILGGITAVPLSFGISDEHKWKFFRIVKQLGRPWVLLEQGNASRLEKFAEINNLQAEWNSIKDRLFVLEQIPLFAGPGKMVEIDENRTAFIQFSSGTTSEPKGVVLSHKNLVTNIKGIGLGLEITPEDTILSWMPLSHDMGLIGSHLVPLFFGISQYIMTTELFIRRPILWLEKMSEAQASITCSPNFGYRHCLNAINASNSTSLNLNKVRLILNGAEPISVPLADEFLETFGNFGLKRESMLTVYGLAEASLAVAFPKAGTHFKSVTLSRSHLSSGTEVVPDESGLSFAVEGKAVLGCQTRITTNEGKILPLNHIGNIEIKGDNVTRGYLNAPELNEEIITDGWLKTGDLGFLNDDGDLVVTGRAKDIIFINGNNYYPQDIEMIAETYFDIEAGKVAACAVRDLQREEDHIIMFVIHKGAEETFYPKIAPLRRIINEMAGVKITEVIPVSKIPKTTSGKIQRYLLGQYYMSGIFDDTINNINAYNLSTDGPEKEDINDVGQKLRIICEDLVPGKQVKIGDNIFEMGTTSLMLAQLHQRINNEFPDVLQIGDFYEYPTIEQLTTHIQSKITNGHAYS